MKSKRKIKPSKICLCSQDVALSKRNLKERNSKLKEIKFKLKPCTVNLIPLDPLVYDFYRDRLKSPHKGTVKKKKKRNLLKTLMKTLKPCSVVLDKINFSDISFPVSKCLTDGARLKPCIVKIDKVNVAASCSKILNSLNIQESVEGTLKELKSCSVIIEKISAKVDSSVNESELDNFTVSLSKDTTNYVSNSIHNNHNLRLSNEVGHNSLPTHEDYNMIENSPISFKDNDIVSHVPDMCGINSRDLERSKIEKQSITTKIVHNQEPFAYNFDNTDQAKNIQKNVPFSSPFCELKTNFKKASEDLKSFGVFKNKIVSYLAYDMKSNEPSSLKSVHNCSHCNKPLPSLKSLYYHSCGGKLKRGYPCKFCGKNFDFYHALRKHKKSHILRNSFSCSDTVKSRHNGKRIKEANLVLQNQKDVKKSQSSFFSGCVKQSVKKNLKGQENILPPKLKPKKLKSKVFLHDILDATTSSGCYSSDSFLYYITNPDDSEVD